MNYSPIPPQNASLPPPFRFWWVLSIAITLYIAPFVQSEQPLFKIENPGISENFEDIYLKLDTHRHFEDGSSFLYDVIPDTTSQYNLGATTRTWAKAYVGQVIISTLSAAPATVPNSVVLYSTISAAIKAELWVKDGAGNATILSPHNETGEWIYWSINEKTGKIVYVNMEEVIVEVEKLSGKKLRHNRRP